jgi:IS5 family transposase
VPAAKVNGGKRRDAVVSDIAVKRERTPLRRNEHLSADAGYRGAGNLRAIEEHGCIARVVERP